MDLDTYLNQFGVKVLDNEDDFVWELIGTSKKNIPLVEARLTRNGSAIAATDKPGVGASRFFLVF